MESPLTDELSIEDTAFTMFAVEEIISLPVGWVHTALNSAGSVLSLPSSVFAEKSTQRSMPSKDPTKFAKLSSKNKVNAWTLTSGWGILNGCCVISSEEQEKEGIVDVESINTMIKVHEDHMEDEHQQAAAATSSPRHHAINFTYPWL